MGKQLSNPGFGKNQAMKNNGMLVLTGLGSNVT